MSKRLRYTAIWMLLFHHWRAAQRNGAATLQPQTTGKRKVGESKPVGPKAGPLGRKENEFKILDAWIPRASRRNIFSVLFPKR